VNGRPDDFEWTTSLCGLSGTMNGTPERQEKSRLNVSTSKMAVRHFHWRVSILESNIEQAYERTVKYLSV
jgi:hypothetical protein